MDRDFRIGKGVELVTPTSVHDIHNLYDFAGFVLVGDGSSWLYFAPTPELGAGRIPVAIEFSGIDFLELGWNPGVIGTPYVDEIGFKSPGAGSGKSGRSDSGNSGRFSEGGSE